MAVAVHPHQGPLVGERSGDVGERAVLSDVGLGDAFPGQMDAVEHTGWLAREASRRSRLERRGPERADVTGPFGLVIEEEEVATGRI